MTAPIAPLDDVAAVLEAGPEMAMRGIALDTQQWALVRHLGRETLRPLSAVPAKHAKRIVARGIPLLTVPHNTGRSLDDGPLAGLAFFPKDDEVGALRAAAGVLLSAGLLSADVSNEAERWDFRLHPDSIISSRATRFVRGLRKDTTLLYLHDSARGGRIVTWQDHLDDLARVAQVLREQRERTEELQRQAQAAASRLNEWLAAQGSELRAEGAHASINNVAMPVGVNVTGQLTRLLAEHAAAHTPA